MDAYYKIIISFIKKLCFLYLCTIVVCFVSSAIVYLLFDEALFYTITGCEIFEPAPFPLIMCNDSVIGSIIEFTLNFPVQFMVISIFGFSSIKGLLLLLVCWGPILFLIWEKRANLINLIK